MLTFYNFKIRFAGPKQLILRNQTKIIIFLNLILFAFRPICGVCDDDCETTTSDQPTTWGPTTTQQDYYYHY